MRLSFPEATWNALDRCTADKSVRHKRGPVVPGRLAAAFTFHHDLLLRKLLPATPRARADKPDVGIPHILKRILRISLLARTVNREPALFWANHGQLLPNPDKVRFADNSVLFVGAANLIPPVSTSSLAPALMRV